MDQGTIPDDWKTTSLRKETHRPENYRPVSLSSIACKTLEHIVCSSILRLLETRSMLTDAQHCFRKRWSYETLLILLPSKI